MRCAAVGVLAGTLTLTGATIAAGVSPANAVEGFAFERLAGADRYGTAAAIARDAFPGGTDTAIIARGDVFADALTANYLAGVMDAPILLTASNDLPQVTADALTALGVDNVIIVGGTTTVSAGVEGELNDDYDVTRYGGADRYLTAELIAQAAADEASVGELNGLATAVLASGQDFPDALALGPIAYAGNHPLLLTRPGDLPASTESLLDELGIEQVVTAGREAAVSMAVSDEVEDIVGADVIRLGGQTRFETATLIAEAAYADFGFDDTHVNLARGDSPLGFADALTGGPHAGMELAPIVLTNPTALPPATEAFLEDNCPTLVDGHIFGGPAAVSRQVEASAEQAAQSCGLLGVGNFNVEPTDGDTTFTAGGAFAGTIRADQPITSVSVTGDCLTAVSGQTDQSGTDEDFQLSVDTLAAAAAGTCTLTFTVTFADGTTATDTVDITVEAAATNQSIDLNPDEDVTLTLADDTTTGTTPEDVAARNADNRTYTASGLTDGEEYRITLVNSDNVAVGADGQVTFLASADADSTTGFSADIGADNADIVSVNNNTALTFVGPIATERRTITVMPVNGSITFTIDGTDVGSVTPVLYVNGGTGGTAMTGGTSARLEVQATVAGQRGAPTESFGIGGTTTFTNPAAASQTFGATAVQRVDKDAKTFDANNLVFTFKATDTFTIAGVGATAAEFEAALSSGDTVSGTFTTDASRPSSFDLVDDNPGTPVAPTATLASSNDVTITATVTGDADTVQFQRATVTGTTVGAFAPIATEPATDDAVDAGTQVIYMDNDVAAGTYQYCIVVTNDGDVSEPSPASASVTTTLTFAATAAGNGTANDTVVRTFSEAVTAFGGTHANRQFFYDADCDGGPDSVFGTVAQSGTNSVTLTLADGTVPTTDDPNDCIGYVDDDPTAVDTGDVVDTSGNALESDSSATVPAATP